MTARVLLTGATGFVGRHVVPLLRKAGFEVHALGRGVVEGAEAISHSVDLLDGPAVERAVRDIGASHLLHLAWYAEPGLYWTSPINLQWVGASLALLRSFGEAGGTRAVCVGTCAEYRWGADDLFDEETSEVAPATLYGAAKDAVRRVSQAYAATVGLSFAWGRLFYLYGPHERGGRLVSDAVNALLAGRPFPTTAGTQRRDFMHVEDVAGALLALLASDVRGCVNVASGEAPAVRSLLEIVARETGRDGLIRFGERSLAASDPKLVGADIARLRGEVGFTPQRGLEPGLAETVRWWRGHQA